MTNEQNKTQTQSATNGQNDVNPVHIYNTGNEHPFLCGLGEGTPLYGSVDYLRLLTSIGVDDAECEKCELVLVGRTISHHGYINVRTPYDSNFVDKRYSYNDGFMNYSVDLTKLYDETGSADFIIEAGEDFGDESFNLKNAYLRVNGNKIADKLIKLFIECQPTKTNYYEGETFDKTGLTVIARYPAVDIDATDEINAEKHLCAEDEVFNISYLDKTVSLDLDIVKCLEFKIETLPDKKYYYSGESFDSAGMIVKARYENGEEKAVTYYTVLPEILKKGDKTVTISCGSKSVTVDVIVANAEDGFFGKKYYGNACIGSNPKWNLATMGVIQNIGGISVGNGAYSVGANLIYVQQMPEILKELCVGMPEGWKLDAQQFLVADGKDAEGSDIYKYIDGEGFVHTFVKYDNSIDMYYDIEGMGLTLNANIGIIYDEQLNELHFENGRLIKIRELIANNTYWEKYYNYENGRLIKIFDGKKNNNCILFTYSNDMITGISGYVAGNKSRQVAFTYENDLLTGISETVSGTIPQEKATFIYDEHNKVCEVRDGETGNVIKLTNSINSLIDNFKTDRISYGKIQNGMFDEYSNETIIMTNYCTSDSKTLNTVCLQDDRGNFRSFELNRAGSIIGQYEGTRNNGYKTLQKETGILLECENAEADDIFTMSTVPTINGTKIYKSLNGVGKILNLPDLMESKYYLLNLFLYHTIHTSKRLFITLYLNGEKHIKKELDISACEIWQKVSLPLIKRTEINEMTFKVTDQTGEEQEILFCDLRVCEGAYSYISFDNPSDENSDYKFEQITSVRLSNATYSVNGGDWYMTENDFLRTMQRLVFKPVKSLDEIDIYFNNGKKRKKANGTINIMGDNDFSFEIKLPKDGINQAWSIKTCSCADNGEMVAEQYFERGIDEFKIVNEITTIEGDDKHKAIAEKIYNFYGRQLSEKDAFGVETKYEYYESGNLKTIKCKSTSSEELTLAEYKEDGNGYIVEETDGNSGYNYSYNNLHGLLENTQRICYNENIKSYYGNCVNSYDDNFKNLIQCAFKTSGTVNCINNIIFKNGEISEFTNGGVRYYINNTKNSAEIGVYNGESKEKRYTVSESFDEARSISKITKELNSYVAEYNFNLSGQLQNITECGEEKAKFTYSNDSESESVQLLERINDNYSGITTEYGFDKDNRINSVKSGELSVEYKNNGKTVYKCGTGELSLQTASDMAGKVLATQYIQGGVVIGAGNKEYDYDGFGRIKSKNGLSYELYGYDGSRLISYKHSKTLPKRTEKWFLGYSDIFDTLQHNEIYTYDIFGNITKKSVSGDIDRITRYVGSSGTSSELPNTISQYVQTDTYSYDAQNRLASENGLQYSYDECGRINNFAGKICTYNNLGHLVKCGDRLYEYDNNGNRIKVSGGISRTYGWTRGRLLASYTENNALKANYTYDYTGKRVQKTNVGTQIKYRYDGERLIEEERTGGKNTFFYYDAQGVCGSRYKRNSKNQPVQIPRLLL